VTFSNDLAFCAYPARAMMAQEPTMTKYNQMMPRSGQPKRFSFHIEINVKTTRIRLRIQSTDDLTL
jgi:hypothetical protein